MHPTTTTYHLATSPRDYRFCQALYKAAEPDGPPVRLGFPTVYAQREGAIIGFLSTNTKHKAVIAGPLTIDPTLKQPIFIAIRLVEAYEEVLKAAGVTAYLFHVDKQKASWLNAIQRSDMQPYGGTDDALWFKREVA